MKNIYIFIFIILGTILLAVGALAGFILYQINTPLSKEEREVMFIVEKGETAKQIGHKLEKQNLISSSFYFETYIYFKKLQDKLQAGIYTLSPSMSPKEIVDWFVQGKANQVKVTIPEGWRALQISKRLDEAGVVREKEFLEAFKTVDESIYQGFDFLDQIPKGQNLEGFLFPDTYIFYKGSKAVDVVKKMLSNFDKKLDETLRKEIENQGKIIFEIITLASIVEREAKTHEEMPKIASVYWNRLKTGMKLDADPTIQYAKGNWDRITKEDYKTVVSPYNTYLYTGLPPGPICNPGLQAIRAVIYPEDTNYFYFFHTPDGETYFSETKEEHDEKKARYLR